MPHMTQANDKITHAAIVNTWFLLPHHNSYISAFFTGVSHFLKCLPIVMMAPSRSRSVSRGQNEDSVKRNRSKSVDRNKSATRSRSKSLPKSKSRSRSKPTGNRRSRSRKRSTSRRKRSGSRRRSRSRSRGRRTSGPRVRSRSPRRSPANDDGYRLHVAGNLNANIVKNFNNHQCWILYCNILQINTTATVVCPLAFQLLIVNHLVSKGDT